MATLYPRSEGARALFDRLHAVAASGGHERLSEPDRSGRRARRPQTPHPAASTRAHTTDVPGHLHRAPGHATGLHAQLHALVMAPDSFATSPVGPPQPPPPSPIPGAELWARLHYWANPGKSGDAIAFGDVQSHAFSDGQVARGPDGTTVAYGQLGAFARASGVSAAWGQTHSDLASAQGMAWAKGELSAMAYARGAYVQTRRSVMAMGEALAEAVARAEVGAHGSSGVGSTLFHVDANLQGATEVGGKGRAAGIAYLGLDSLGLPAVELGGQAGGMAGARAEGMAGAGVWLLGLLRVRVGAVAQGMAGAAGGALAHVKFRDGDLALRFGASGAAGVGGQVTTEVGIELGKLPKGLLMTTVAPIVQAPILLINSIGKLLGRQDKPGEYTPGITDFPRLAGQTMVAGAQMVATGAVEIVGDIGRGAVAAGEGLATGARFVGKTAADAVVGVGDGVWTGVKFVGNTIASIFKGW